MNDKRNIKILIFDLGNVVVKFDHHVATRNIARLSGLGERRVYRYIFTSGVERLFDCGKISAKEFYKIISKKFVKPVTYPDFRDAWADIFRPNPGVGRLLKRLKGKFSLCLLSNINAIHFPFVKKKFPIAGIFGKYFLSYKLHFCKPDKRLFKEILKYYRAIPDECLFIDDIKEYTQAAKKLGFNVITYRGMKALKTGFRKLKISY